MAAAFSIRLRASTLSYTPTLYLWLIRYNHEMLWFVYRTLFSLDSQRKEDVVSRCSRSGGTLQRTPSNARDAQRAAHTPRRTTGMPPRRPEEQFLPFPPLKPSAWIVGEVASDPGRVGQRQAGVDHRNLYLRRRHEHGKRETASFAVHIDVYVSAIPPFSFRVSRAPLKSSSMAPDRSAW